MIRAGAVSRDGVPILLIGLPGADLSALLRGQPISFDATDYIGTAVRVMVLGGPNAAAILADMNDAGMTVKEGTIYPYEPANGVVA